MVYGCSAQQLFCGGEPVITPVAEYLSRNTVQSIVLEHAANKRHYWSWSWEHYYLLKS